MTPNKTPPETDAPQFVENLILQAERAGVSDIHLQMQGKEGRISFRLDGVMASGPAVSEGLADRVAGRIKYLARLKTYQESMPQDGRINRADVGAKQDIRVATYPTVTGEKIVLRLFADAVTQSLSELVYPTQPRLELEQCLRRTSGLLLLTGPAGSGKTTTIYACLRSLVELGGRHVITVEDPVEQVVPGIMQTEVNEARGLTFATAARHLLRQDPQVLVVGEIRDEETANVTVRASLTGHLVIATLHAGSCRGVFERLLAMGPDSYSVVSAIELVINQRLVRRLCPDCGGPGCVSCLSTGYRGRVPLVEWFRMDDTLRTRIRSEGPGIIRPLGSLDEAGREILEKKLSDESELKRVLA